MQAIVFQSPGNISIEQVKDPVCETNDVVIQISQSGICGTDLHIYHDEFHSKFPLIAGHEFGGVIVEAGKAVTSLKCGDRVVVDPNLYCGECYFCRQEQSNHCLNWHGVGITRPGGFAQYVSVPARAAYKIPESLTDTQATFIEPVSCVIYALRRLRVWPGDEVLIFGAGPMGLLLVQAMKRSGACRIDVVEKRIERRNLCLLMGANTAIDANTNLRKTLFEQAPYGYAIVVDATGMPDVIRNALQFVKPRGQYLQFGVAPKSVSVAWEPYEIYHKDLTIIGSFALCYTFQPAVAWIANHVVEVENLVSHILPLTEFEAGFRDFAAGNTLKVHIRP